MSDQLSVFDLPEDINLYVPWYLMSCYLYYQLDVAVLDDGAFDTLCKLLHENFDQIEHQHKYLIDTESLKAGTGYELVNKLPSMVKGAAEVWYKDTIGETPQGGWWENREQKLAQHTKRDVGRI